MELSNHIYRATKKHGVPARIYTAILMQESSYKLDAMNCMSGVPVPKDCSKKEGVVERKKCEALIYSPERVCEDFGIAQVHYKTARSYKMNIRRLTTDLKYSVDAGAKVLAWFYKTYEPRENDWWIRYNVGTRPKHKVLRAWKAYKRLVERYL